MKTFTVHHETKTGPWYRPFSERLMGTVQAESGMEASGIASVLWPAEPFRIVNGTRAGGTVVHIREVASATLAPHEARADAKELSVVGRVRRERHGAP